MIWPVRFKEVVPLRNSGDIMVCKKLLKDHGFKIRYTQFMLHHGKPLHHVHVLDHKKAAALTYFLLLPESRVIHFVDINQHTH